MTFRAKLALGFAAIMMLLLLAAGYASLRNVNNLSARLRSSYADTVIPLRNAQTADETFTDLRMHMQLAVLQHGAARKHLLEQFESQRRAFEEAFAIYERGATHEPAMQELLAKYGVQKQEQEKLRTALDAVNDNYALVQAKLDKVAAALKTGDEQTAERTYAEAVPLFNNVEKAFDRLEELEVKDSEYLDKESQAVAQAAVRQIPLIAAVAMALGIVLVLAVARSVTEPLLRLTAAAQKVKAGDLDQVVKVESRDEVGQLALAFNTMTESLRTVRAELEDRVEARTRELAAANEQLNAQMAERERAAHALEQAKDAAEAANRAKGEFLAKMSHELRTPLNGVIGAVQLILNTDLDGEQREYLQIARTSADGLLQVINDILDFSRVESGKLRFEDVDFNLRHSLQDALTTLSVRAAEKGLALTCHVAPEIPEVLVGDPGRLRQVVLNLVGNAIKFTEQGRVTVKVEAQERSADEVTLHFAISDTGMGISPEHRATIFAPFEQGDGSITRKYGGTGLGLAISAQLVDIMGGTVWVDSEVGQGSTFHFTARFGMSAERSAKPLPKRMSQLKGVRVLIADDDAGDCRELEQILAQWGMVPANASTGSAALLALQNAAGTGAPFQLLLADCQMPGALALAETVNDRPDLALPIVVTVRSLQHLHGSALACPKAAPLQTRCADCADHTPCRELGVTQYLLKPVRQSQLLDAVLGALNPAQQPNDKPAAAATTENPKLRILIAEDNLINQKIALRALEKWGHSVDVANNGREALEKLDQQQFDLILMDLQMPELDGFQTTRVIREREKLTGEHVPIIAVTAHAMHGDSERCIEAGMDSYVSKPLQLEKLFDEIRALMALCGPAPGQSQRAGGAHQDAGGTALSAPLLDAIDISDRELASLSSELMDDFLCDTPAQLKRLRLAAQNRDAATLKSVAHYLKGGAMYLGARKMVKLCKEIEAAASRDLSRAVAAVAALETETARMCAAVECRLQALNFD